jgi:hypothetical protein
MSGKICIKYDLKVYINSTHHHPSRFPTYENWSGGSLHPALGGNLTEKAPIFPLLATYKRFFFVWQVKKTLV